MAKKIKHSDLIEGSLFAKTIEEAKALNVVLNATEKQFKDVLKASTKATNKIPQTKKGIDDFTTATNKSRQAVEGLKVVEKQRSAVQKQLKASTDREIKGKLRLQKVNKEQRDHLKAEIVLVDKLAGTEEKLLAKNTKLRLARKKLNTTTRAGRKELKLINKTLDKNNKLIDKNSDKLKKQKRNVGNYGSALKGIRGALGGFGVALGGAAIASNIVGIFSGFQDEAANLASVLGKTRKEAVKLTNDAKRLGATTAFTAKEVLKLQTEFAKLGFNENEILDATEATLALAAATGTELGEAAAIAGATLGGFGLEADETQRVVDVMAKSFTTSALDMEKFKESMKTAAPAAKAVGISVEETTALLGTMANAGISGSKAGNNLKTSLINLNKAGLTLDEGLKKVAGSSDKLGAATKLVGKNAAASFLVLAEGKDTTDELTKGLQNAGGAAQKMADTQLDTLTGRTKLMTSAWEGFILSLEDGDGIFAQVANNVVEGITNMLTKMADLGKSAGELQDNLTGQRVGIAQGHVNEALQKQLELFELSNDELIKRKEAGESGAEAELGYRKREFTDGQKIVTLNATKSLVRKKEIKALEEELRLRKANGEVFGNVARRRQIDFLKGFQQAEKDLAISKLKQLTEGELLELANKQKIIGKDNKQQNVVISNQAKAELQRRKDIGGVIYENNEGLNNTGGITERILTGLAKIKKELADINKLRSDEMVLNGDSTRFRQLSAESKELKAHIDYIEARLALESDGFVAKPRGDGSFIDAGDSGGNSKDLLDEAGKSVTTVAIEDETEDEAAALAERAQMLENALDLINDIIKKKSAERLALIDKEIQANKEAQDTFRQLAADGVVNAKENLAFEKRKAAELELQKKREIERAAKQELAMVAIKTYSSYVQSGESGGKALASTVTDIAVLKAFISGLDFFYEGTENTGTANNPLDSNGGRLAVLHDNERVMTAEQNKMVSGLSNWELANLGADYKSGENSVNEALISQRFQSNHEIISKFDSLENAINNIEAPHTSFHYDSMREAFIKTVESSNKIERTINKKSKLF